MTIYDDYRRRMQKRFPEFRVCQARCCPRVVAGARCLVGYGYRLTHWPSGGTCLCLRYSGTLLDHATIWHIGERRYVLTAEPYGVKWDLVERFRKEVRDFSLDLRLDVTDESYWFEGTRLLIIRRTDAAQ